MSFRRELLTGALLTILLLALVPATAAAAPRWLGAETRVADAANAAPDVATYGETSAAVWIGQDGHVYVAERPRGGPWGAPVDVLPAGGADASQAPKIAARFDGELAVMWFGGFDVHASTRPPGGSWTPPQTVSSSCCIALEDLVAGGDGSFMGLFSSGDGPTQTATKDPGDRAFDPPQDVPDGSDRSELAVAPDGGALVVQPVFFSCQLTSCVEAVYRPARGNWGTPEPLAATAGNVNAVAVAARSNSGFTALWSEDAALARSQNPPGALISRDRGPLASGTWGPADTVTASATDAVGCPSSFGCVDLAIAGDDTLAAVWQQGPGTPAIAASLRPPGGSWGSRETVGTPDGGDAFPQAAFTAGGLVVAGWGADDGTTARVAHRAGPNDWQRRDLGTASSPSSSAPVIQDVAADAEGNAVTAFTNFPAARTAGFDGAGPRFSAFSVSNTTTAGEPIQFRAAANDNWSGPPAISWLFGDGTGANGGSASHVYTAAGTYTARVTATDGVGNAAQASAPVTITGNPPTCGNNDADGDKINDLCDNSDGAMIPIPFKTLNATVVTGDVFIKPPAGTATAAQGGKAPKGFRPLVGAETIPFGSQLDTRKGRVRLRSAKSTRKRRVVGVLPLQIGVFSAGRFLVKQRRRPRARGRRSRTKLLTDITLRGSSFRRACGRSSGSSSTQATTSARRRSRRRVRRLFGDGKGSFRTRGRNAAATVRGTRWGVQDRCDGTLVVVRQGRVVVRDLVKKKNILVKAPRTYLARRR